MKKYLVDTNIISYLADIESRFHENVRTRFRNLSGDDEVFLSILGLYEFYYNFSRASAGLNPDILRAREKMLTTLPVVPLSRRGGQIFGELKTLYQHHYHLPGTALARDTVDLMIASSALEIGATLVSHDGVFQRIRTIRPDLEVQDWAL